MLIAVDVECYQDYLLVCTLSEFGEQRSYEGLAEAGRLLEILRQPGNTTLTFNGLHYDLSVLSEATRPGATLESVWQHSKRRINDANAPPVAAGIVGDHIDIMPVAPLRASLKLYGARMHAPLIEALPHPPSEPVGNSEELKRRLVKYCINDCRLTLMLHGRLAPAIELRRSLGSEYGIDMRSLSDAQIGETIVMRRLGSVAPPRKPSRVFRYQAPAYIRFRSPELKALVAELESVEFPLRASGRYGLPESLQGRTVTIADTDYAVGIGGLHSTEKGQSVEFPELLPETLLDIDVASYYPNIILADGLYPAHIDKSQFLAVYRELISDRLAAKKAGETARSDGLKIAINSVFGKLASKYSALYSPGTLLQITITGQLALLMLAERCESEGVQVLSANTDGLFVAVHNSVRKRFGALCADWMDVTGHTLEGTRYVARYAAGVNDYLALRPGGGSKRKGVWANTGLAKNPVAQVCIDAAYQHLSFGMPIGEYVKECPTFTDFVTVRKVVGGAVWKGKELGPVVRWYYSATGGAPIHRKDNGAKVPLTDGAVPVMSLPETIPADVDHWRYEAAAKSMLDSAGAVGLGAWRTSAMRITH